MSPDCTLPGAKEVLLIATTKDAGLRDGSVELVTVAQDGAVTTKASGPLNVTVADCGSGATPPVGAENVSAVGATSTASGDRSTTYWTWRSKLLSPVVL